MWYIFNPDCFSIKPGEFHFYIHRLCQLDVFDASWLSCPGTPKTPLFIQLNFTRDFNVNHYSPSFHCNCCGAMQLYSLKTTFFAYNDPQRAFYIFLWNNVVFMKKDLWSLLIIGPSFMKATICAFQFVYMFLHYMSMRCIHKSGWNAYDLRGDGWKLRRRCQGNNSTFNMSHNPPSWPIIPFFCLSLTFCDISEYGKSHLCHWS